MGEAKRESDYEASGVTSLEAASIKRKRTFFWTIVVGIFILFAWISGSASTNQDGASTQSNESPTYQSEHGDNACTDDCSGHDAGYEWGEENEICDTDYDNGNSESFNEGVRAWAEDNCSEDDGYTDDYY